MSALSDRLCAAGKVFQARELANNVACWSNDTPDLAAHIAMAIRHRLANGWAVCGDVDSCAVAMARAFSRHHAATQWDGSVDGGRRVVAVGRKGPAFGATANFQVTTGRA